MTEKIKIKIKKKDGSVATPVYKTTGSAGCDVCALSAVNLFPGQRILVGTGIYLEIPEGYECQIRSRSGLAFSKGVIVLNGVGTIDSDYRGEVGALLYNASKEFVGINEGDRIAQLVFAPVVQVDFEEVEDLDETERSDGGWGSTGQK